MKFDLLAFGLLTLDTFVDPQEIEVVQNSEGKDVMQIEIGAKIPRAEHLCGTVAGWVTAV